jgi:predicted homoserine dehydrogenase-like protein
VNLHRLLQQRVMNDGPPVRVGLIGAGKFGSMFLSQVPTIRGLEVPVIADLDPDRARLACDRVGWDAARIERTAFVASGNEACGHPDVAMSWSRQPAHPRSALRTPVLPSRRANTL